MNMDHRATDNLTNAWPVSPDNSGCCDVLPTREGYDLWSSIYDSEDNPLITLEGPIVAKLLGDPHGLRIADIGCGTGRHANRLAQLGAEVTALDFSDGMLAKAKAKQESGPVVFIQHDLHRPLPLPPSSFDRVLCCLVLDHIAEPVSPLEEMGRVCRPDGFIVVSVMHPALMLRGLRARFFEPNSRREIRPASHPHRICDYVMAATRAGLQIESVDEHVADSALVAQSPRAGKYSGWPMLLTMKLRP